MQEHEVWLLHLEHKLYAASITTMQPPSPQSRRCRRRDVACRAGRLSRLRILCGEAFRCVTVYRSKSRANPSATLIDPKTRTERIRAWEYAKSPGTSDCGPDGGCEPDMAEISHTRTRLRGPWVARMEWIGMSAIFRHFWRNAPPRAFPPLGWRFTEDRIRCTVCRFRPNMVASRRTAYMLRRNSRRSGTGRAVHRSL